MPMPIQSNPIQSQKFSLHTRANTYVVDDDQFWTRRRAPFTVLLAQASRTVKAARGKDGFIKDFSPPIGAKSVEIYGLFYSLQEHAPKVYNCSIEG